MKKEKRATHLSRYASTSSPSTKLRTLHLTMSNMSSQTSRGTLRSPNHSWSLRGSRVGKSREGGGAGGRSSTEGENHSSNNFSAPVCPRRDTYRGQLERGAELLTDFQEVFLSRKCPPSRCRRLGRWTKRKKKEEGASSPSKGWYSETDMPMRLDWRRSGEGGCSRREGGRWEEG